MKGLPAMVFRLSQRKIVYETLFKLAVEGFSAAIKNEPRQSGAYTDVYHNLNFQSHISILNARLKYEK